MEAILERDIQTPELENQQNRLAMLGSVANEGAPELDHEQAYIYSELVPSSLWQRLTNRIEKDEEIDNEYAQRIMNESLGFLKACAENPGVALAPSEKVDGGWHTFILYTKDYAEVCENTAGKFIHHEPTDSGVSEEGAEAMTIKDTLDFLQEKGYEVDPELWLTDLPIDDRQRCSSHCRNTCGRN